MSFFEAKVQATLDTSKFQSEIKKLENKAIRFNNVSFNTAKLQSTVGKTKITLNNVKIDTSKLGAQVRQALNQPFNIQITGADASKLSAQLKTAGQSAGQNLQRSITQGVDNASKSASQFAKKYDKALSAVSTGKLEANLESVKAKFEGVRNSISELPSASAFTDMDSGIQKNIKSLGDLTTQMHELSSKGEAGQQELVSTFEQYNSVLATTKNQLSTASSEMRQFATASQVAASQTKMEQFLNSGTKAAKEYGDKVRTLSEELKNLSSQGKVSASDLSRINNEFAVINSEAKVSGNTVQTFGSKLKAGLGKFANYVGASTMIMGSINTIKKGVNEVVELDNALVDLKKTSDGTTSQLDEFYYSANDIAKELGTSTKEVIQSAADWSRLGYSLKDAETMSRVSSIFQSISPGMDIEMANDGLISAMKAKYCLVA